jgi:hypothetical protein
MVGVLFEAAIFAMHAWVAIQFFFMMRCRGACSDSDIRDTISGDMEDVMCAPIPGYRGISIRQSRHTSYSGVRTTSAMDTSMTTRQEIDASSSIRQCPSMSPNEVRQRRIAQGEPQGSDRQADPTTP